MVLKDLDGAIRAVRAAHLFEEAKTWFEIPAAPVSPSPPDSLDAASTRRGNRAKERIYAENEVAAGFLTTEALRNLGRAYCDEIPNAVLIGAKGSGKTFSYLQIALSRTWDKFLAEVGLTYTGDGSPALMVPLLRSTELGNATLSAVRTCFEDFQKSLGLDLVQNAMLGFSEPTDLVRQELGKASNHVPDWTAFWVKLLSRAVASNAESLQELSEELGGRKTRVVFLLDGLEDLFQHVEDDSVQRSALEALIDVPNRIRDLRSPSLGLLVFVREDYARVAKAQNFGQFQARYSKYQLNWSPREFLQLVYWLCADAKVIRAEKAAVDSMTTDQLVESLHPLWGKKLGRNDAAEAYTARWVYSALSDLRGRLQARDVVRFVAHSASQSESKRLAVWTDRLLPPAAIRAAIPMVSSDKVREAAEEYPALKRWQELLASVPADRKRIPFSADDTKLDGMLRQNLQELGVIFEDAEKADAERLYVPEIYRGGLGLGAKAGARPRVQALLQRSLGKLPF